MAQVLPDSEEFMERLVEERTVGANFVLDRLAKALGLERWTIRDGSETWDGDVAATMWGILHDARVIDPETNDRLAASATMADLQLERDTFERQYHNADGVCAVLRAKKRALLETLVWVRANYASGPTAEINARIDAALSKAGA